jgi:hypothetical protein
MGRWGKNKCAANVCRHLCVGIAALLFLRSVGCIVMLVVLVSVEIMNCRHSMTHNVQGFAVVVAFISVKPRTKVK